MEKNEMQNSRIENEMQSSGMGKNVNQNSGISRRGEENAPYYLGMTLIYSVCFAFAFYRNYIGITFPLITAATLAACVLFLRKKRIPWKKSSWLYAAACLLLSISTVLTANIFVIFFNTVGILLLITVFMLRQMYDDRGWKFIHYVGNLLFLYLNMIPELAAPFIHLAHYLKKHGKQERKNKKLKYIMLGVLIGLPMLSMMVALLSSADQIFAKVVGKTWHGLFGQVIFSPNVFLVILLMVLGFFGIYSFLSAVSLDNMPQYGSGMTKKNPLTAITFLSMVAVIYVVFCAIQVTFLFTGGMLLPEGYTYAEYAHQGFFQLLFVCFFNLALVGACMTVFERNRILNLLLLLCCGCTYIMMASSAFRMILYIRTYHLTFLRVLVLWFLAMLAALLAGVVIALFRHGFQLFYYCVGTVAVFYLVFSFMKTDALVAEYNVAQIGEDISYEDLKYLAGLSLDAVPLLSRYNFEHENCRKDEGRYVEEYDYYALEVNWYYDSWEDAQQGCRRCLLNRKFRHVLEDTEGMDIRTFHLSKYLARKAAREYWKP